jgi:hypothetical protein
VRGENAVAVPARQAAQLELGAHEIALQQLATLGHARSKPEQDAHTGRVDHTPQTSSPRAKTGEQFGIALP